MARQIIAFMYDYDKTLCTTNMQEYTFIPNVDMAPEQFWSEVAHLAKSAGMDPILAYLKTMLDQAHYARKSIRRNDFVDAGKDIRLFPGVRTWFERMNAYAQERDAQLEHYIISSGLREIIEGSPISDEFREIFACQFHYDENGVACWPKSVVNYTAKTQFLFRINKGILDLSDDDSLNEFTPEEDRRIPFRNMLYVGDGMTDVPCMKLVKAHGGYSIAVHPKDRKETAESLLRDGRVNFIAPADYSKNSQMERLAKEIIDEMISREKLVDFGLRQHKAAETGCR